MFFSSSAVHEQNYILELLISKLAPDLFLKAHFLLFVDVYCVPCCSSALTQLHPSRGFCHTHFLFLM